MSKISVLMTVYNEGEFLEQAIRSCVDYVDHVVIVEGAYQETIALGKPKRSTDKTLDIIDKFAKVPVIEEDKKDKKEKKEEQKVFHIEANEKTDKDQRNVGLEKIKELNPDGWCLIIDGDEIYNADTFQMIKVAARNMERTNKYGAYFKSLTFVNDFEHFTEQEFPRLFRITKKCQFVDDNYMAWPDKDAGWNLKHVMKIPYISYFHMSFCKGVDRFKIKRDWWMNRGLGKDFDYGWKVGEDGKISDKNHEIHKYSGRLPDILKDHPLYPGVEEKKDGET